MKNMYNTIEVMKMDIKKVEIKTLKTGGLDSTHSEGVKHVKILPFLSVVQSMEGSYDISLGNDETKQTGTNGFFIAPSEVQQTIVHHVDPHSGRMRCRWLFLDVVVDGRHRFDKLFRFPATPDEAAKRELNRLFDLLFESEDVFEKYSLCYQILGVLFRIARPVSLQGEGGIQNALHLMKNDFAREIRIEDLAASCCMSESNLYAVFKKQYGISPMAYLNRYRLSVAAEKLAETDESIKEIGSAVGIKDPLYFSKLFKKSYSVSPREYRLSHKK